MDNSRITPTKQQTAENIIFDLLADGRNTKRKRINSLKEEIFEFEYIIKDFTERFKIQRSIWYMGEIYLMSDLEAIKQEYKTYLQALEIVQSENNKSKPKKLKLKELTLKNVHTLFKGIEKEVKLSDLTINLGLENNPFSKEFISDYLNLDFYDIDIRGNERSVKIGYKTATYLGKDERTIISQGSTPHTLDEVKETVKGYLRTYKQECIAIEYDGKGYLIYSDKTPQYKRLDFDYNYFVKL